MKVQMLDLTGQYKDLKPEILPAVEKLMDSQMFIGGQVIKDFESNLAKYSDSKFAVGCASGSDAIILALLAMGIKPGDEVITPSFTFFATAGAVAILGAKPVFVD